MAKVVLRVRLTSGDQMDVSYDNPSVGDVNDAAEAAITALADDAGVLRARHGDRLIVLYGRGVAAIEITPRGAVL